MSTRAIMLWVLAALLPGICVSTWFLGPGVLWNLAILSVACLAVEAFALQLAGKPFNQLLDGSALLTAWLIAICLPPYVPAAYLLLAALAAVGLAKHAYGGLGRNTFNPAMVGYAVLLVSFPAQLATWPALANTDALSGATLLTEFRYREGLTSLEFAQSFAASMAQQQWLSGAFLIGGLVLLYKKIAAWRIPAAMFGALLVCALFGYDQGSSTSLGSAWFHASAGGFVITAFFIATDPVSHPRQPSAQVIYGVLIGVVVYCIRAFGVFPDGLAFAVLLGNCITPLLNRIYASNLGTLAERV